jgi:phospholipid-translocating ATPase
MDGVLLHSSDPTGSVFVRTDQLDGETDWKLRESVKFTQEAMHKIPEVVFNNNWVLEVDPPNDKIESFKGVFKTDRPEDRQPLDLSNTIWSNMTLATGDVFLLAMYVGQETRTSLNSKGATTKFGKTDEELNTLFKTIFLILVGIAAFIFAIGQNYITWRSAVEIVRIFTILSTLLPFMLKLNVDFAKMFYSRQIEQDPAIEGTIVRNQQIPEELGRIEYLLSDKTGTLTKNEMIFKLLQCRQASYAVENIDRFKEHAKDVCRPNASLSEEDEALRTTLYALLLCNNVSPNFVGDRRMLQASSPDEIALVNFAEQLGFEMKSRTKNKIKVTNPFGTAEEFDILDVFPFTSASKRMGIILRDCQKNQILFFMKGADEVVIPKLETDTDRITVEEESMKLSQNGLRTLVLAFRELSDSDYKDFAEKMEKAKSDLRKMEQKVAAVMKGLETKMIFLGVTAVEDLLQEKIKLSIETLRSAGIKVWMITGDKLETAKNIAITTGFKNSQNSFWEISEVNPDNLRSNLEDFSVSRNPNLQTDTSLLNYTRTFNLPVITGASLEVILHTPDLRKLFVQKIVEADAVVLCRCAPKQKAEVALLLQKELKKSVCGIGDGGNDVGLIQSASIGIGIEGKEGKQAALASDFSVRQFKDIVILILWHGRMSYLRSAALANLVVHRGFIQTAMQYFFMLNFAFVSINLFNGYLNMFYGTFFTNFLVFSMVYDYDISRETALEYPGLYREVQKGIALNAKQFLIFVFKAVYQGAFIIFITFLIFEPTTKFTELSTITFTALLLVEYLTVISTIKNWHRMMLLGFFLGLLIYLACFAFFSKLFMLVDVTGRSYLKLFVLVLVGWLPIQLGYFIAKRCYPSRAQILMGGASEGWRQFFRDRDRKEFSRSIMTF